MKEGGDIFRTNKQTTIASLHCSMGKKKKKSCSETQDKTGIERMLVKMDANMASPPTVAPMHVPMQSLTSDMTYFCTY